MDMLKKLLVSILAAIGAFCAPALCDEGAMPSSDRAIFGDDGPLTTHPGLLQARWELVLDAIGSDDLKAVNDGIYALDQLRLQGGFHSLKEFSQQLLERGYSELEQRDLESAAFYARKALQISPDSLQIKLASIRLVNATGVEQGSDLVKSILFDSAGDLRANLAIFRHGAYPLLWASTLGLVAALYLFLIYHLKYFLRALAAKMPTSAQPATPLVLLALLVGPLFMGPLWSILVWSLVVSLLRPGAKRFLVAGGVLLAAWAVIVPQRERLQAWASMDGAAALQNALFADFDVSDRAGLERLLKARPTDGVAQYAYGVVLRRFGEYAASEQAFQKAEAILGSIPQIRIQRALTHFLNGRSGDADKLLAEVEESGYSSPELYFNHSKVKFDLTDTQASRELYAKANDEDPELTEFLRKREDLLGMRSSGALAELRLPYSVVSESIAMSAGDATERQQGVVGKLMPGFGAFGIGSIGVAMIAIGLLMGAGQRRRPRLPPLYKDYNAPAALASGIKFVPGGAWLAAGKPVASVVLISVFFLLLMPIIGWPYGGKVMAEMLIGVYPFYLCTVAFAALLTCYVGSFMEEEE